MESINLTKQNLESLKLIDFNGLDKNILFHIIDLLNNINFKNIDIVNSFIEIRNEINNDSICITLSSKKCIPMEIILHKNYIDMTVADFQTIREMHKIKDSNIDAELKFLSKWINSDIINEIKYSGKLIVYSKFYNKLDFSDVIFKSTSLFTFLSVVDNKKNEYKSWID